MNGWLSPEEWTAVRLSLLVATTATLASLPLGLATALLLAAHPQLRLIGLDRDPTARAAA